MFSTKLVAISQGVGDLADKTAEQIIAYVARVSNPKNQLNIKTAPKLLAYCIKQKHWSVFEQVSMTIEIVTSRAISAQILRHRSFNFQEFSTRYSRVENNIIYPARRQDDKNRQNSIDDLDKEIKEWFDQAQQHIWEESKHAYDEAVEKGVAKEQARMLLPMNSQTTVMMTGNVRNFIHFIELRSGNGAQKEIQDIARSIQTIFIEQFPNISEALGWTSTKEDRMNEPKKAGEQDISQIAHI